MKDSTSTSETWRTSSPIVDEPHHVRHHHVQEHRTRQRYRLEPNEQVKRVVKPHWTSLLPAMAFLGSLFVIPAVAAAMSFRYIAIVSLLAVSTITALTAWLLKIRFDTNGVVVTNQRLICTHGLFEPDMREIPIGHITNIASHHDFLQRLAGSGTVQVDVGGSFGPEILPNVADPDGLAELLVHEVDKFESGLTAGPVVAAPEPFRTCPVDELSRLYGLLRNGAVTKSEYEQLKRQLLSASSDAPDEQC